ncbi:MAG TPA: glycosyltransferase family 87 protein [Candidatus Limnocylindrales bacterium]|nr:glycosyltransferase family 87 protein [Candidatus Limnocylindrales bacterium]
MFAFIYARGELAGADALAYWTGVQRWLRGEDIYQVIPGLYVAPRDGALPYAYAPWSLYVFLPFGLIPWDIVWPLWRAANLVLFALSVGWAYQRRPLATAALVAVLGPALAANLDTGNINIVLALMVWAAWWSSPQIGGFLWALGAGLKFVPAALLPFVPTRAWGYGFMTLGVMILLTLATWPQTVRQLDIVINYPRPLRIDYMMLLWAVVPWLYSRPLRPRLDRDWLAVVNRAKREAVGDTVVTEPASSQFDT